MYCIVVRLFKYICLLYEYLLNYANTHKQIIVLDKFHAIHRKQGGKVWIVIDMKIKCNKEYLSCRKYKEKSLNFNKKIKKRKKKCGKNIISKRKWILQKMYI